MSNHTPNAWMLRRDGLEIPVIQHIYGSHVDLDETLYAAEWLYNHTALPETQKLVLQLISAYGRKLDGNSTDPFKAIVGDIHEKPYIFLTEAFLREHLEEIPWEGIFDSADLSSQVIEALNQEFLRARYGGMYTSEPGCHDMYFRVSSRNFNWKPVIEGFLYRHHQRVDTITVIRDEESTGQKFYYRDENGQPVKHRCIGTILKQL